MDESLNEPLARFTTLRIGGQAERLYQPKSTEEFVSLMNRLNRSNEAWYILGGGSNLLVSSAGVKGNVIRTAQMTAFKQVGPNILDAAAGVRLPHLAKQAALLNLSGLEFSVGIPGTIGGAVVMNAGAHGSCIAEIIESVTIFDIKTNKLVTLNTNELTFTYRKSSLDLKTQVVVSAKLRLKPGVKSEIEAKIKANEEYRLKTQPINYPSAGSTFVNPKPERSAGFLLEQAGAKGLTCGQAAVSTLHANFVINLGTATSKDVTDLLTQMQERVYNAFTIQLHPEWKTLGQFSKDELNPWQASSHPVH
jgi:UDP-N-acetylmuramate dehydrogenase